MNARMTRWVWLLPASLIASVGGSLLVVWALSSLAGFEFSPSVVAVLSAAAWATAVAVVRRNHHG